MNGYLAIAIAAVFIWLGMVLAISFLEAPLKFRAPGITIPLGLGIGRLAVVGLGWIAARVDIRHLVSESRSLPRSYYKGLNALLNEEPDKAIELFIEIARLDPETAELHFALGKLFRQRGDIERAVRVHQNLLARADLSIEVASLARYELGQDYLKAGLLDRAEDCFNQLAPTQYGTAARRARCTRARRRARP